jgi:hypothetical protein
LTSAVQPTRSPFESDRLKIQALSRGVRLFDNTVVFLGVPQNTAGISNFGLEIDQADSKIIRTFSSGAKEKQQFSWLVVQPNNTSTDDPHILTDVAGNLVANSSGGALILRVVSTARHHRVVLTGEFDESAPSNNQLTEAETLVIKCLKQGGIQMEGGLIQLDSFGKLLCRRNN